ncbi:MAG: hypothetical protein IGR93_16615, partial [Hydrococcus sp. C42_A2020_068]|nr:hypothetical protein [Hydrococcus sp. C42_A2020_068]
ESFPPEAPQPTGEAASADESDWGDLFSDASAEAPSEMASFESFTQETIEPTDEATSADDSDWGDFFSDSQVNSDRNGQLDQLDNFFQENTGGSEKELLDMFQTEETDAQSSETSSNGHLDLDGFDELFGEEISNKSHKEEKI